MLQSTVEDTIELSERVALTRSVYSDVFSRPSSGTYTSRDCTVRLAVLLYSAKTCLISPECGTGETKAFTSQCKLRKGYDGIRNL